MGGNLFEELSKDLGDYLKSGYRYDVKIHVGEHNRKTFDAHSVILAARSPYFRREINDIPQSSRRSIIEFREPKISPNAFAPLLRYIYTGVVPLHNIETDNLLDILLATNEPLLSDDPSSVVDFILTANQLELSELVNHLQNVLINDRTKWLCENVDNNYARISRIQSLKILKDFYKNMIRTNVELMFQLESLPKIPLNDVIQIASRDDLLVDEIEVWNQVVRWSVAQFSNLPKDPERWTNEQCDDVKLIMENFIHLIRWSHISGKEFTADVVPYSKILPDELYQDLVRYHVDPDKMPESFNLPKRVGKIQSNLISIEHASLISQWIKSQHTSSSWGWVNPITKTVQYRYNLLTRGSQDGFSKSDFQEACQHKGPTITLIRLEGSDLIIGGYNPIPWTTSERPDARTQKSFIFAFDNDRDDPVKAGRLSKLENSRTCPIISITDKGLNLGKDLSLKFTDSHNEIDLNYRSVEYTLLDNVQRQIENPMRIKDYEVFTIHNIPTSSQFQLSRIFRKSTLFLRDNLIIFLGVVVKFMDFLLEYRVPGKIYEFLKFIIFDVLLKYRIIGNIFEVFKFLLKTITFELLPILYGHGKSFVESEDTKRWWYRDGKELTFIILGTSFAYLVLWYLGYFLFHPGHENVEVGFLFWIWDWAVTIALIAWIIFIIVLFVNDPRKR